MPNIVIIEPSVSINSGVKLIVGLVANVLKNLEEGIMEESVITQICGVCHIAGSEEKAPFIIVRDTNIDRGKMIAKALNESLNIDVELEIIQAFYSKSQK